jgi:hypothetical protein
MPRKFYLYLCLNLFKCQVLNHKIHTKYKYIAKYWWKCIFTYLRVLNRRKGVGRRDSERKGTGNCLRL